MSTLNTTDSDCCGQSASSSVAERLKNIVVHTHESRRAVFYRDFVQGKIVFINLMSIEHDAKYPVTANLAKVQDCLGERLGRDIFMISITLDPGKDSPGALNAFAKKHGARKGWHFLTGEPEKINFLAANLFGHAHAVHHGASHLAESQACALGILRYGNDAADVWGTVPAKTNPEWIARRAEWISAKRAEGGPPVRRGPAPLGNHNAISSRIS